MMHGQKKNIKLFPVMLPASSNIACLKDFRRFRSEIRISIYFWVLLQLGLPVNLGLYVGVNSFTCGPLS
jgi:hypothetical protein